MRTVSAIEVRKHFGKLVDEAAAGERLIIERAGQPVAALVPLSDVPGLNREELIRRRLQALEEIRRMARDKPLRLRTDAAKLIREQRERRTQQILRATRPADPGK